MVRHRAPARSSANVRRSARRVRWRPAAGREPGWPAGRWRRPARARRRGGGPNRIGWPPRPEATRRTVLRRTGPAIRRLSATRRPGRDWWRPTAIRPDGSAHRPRDPRRTSRCRQRLLTTRGPAGRPPVCRPASAANRTSPTSSGRTRRCARWPHRRTRPLRSGPHRFVGQALSGEARPRVRCIRRRRCTRPPASGPPTPARETVHRSPRRAPVPTTRISRASRARA